MMKVFLVCKSNKKSVHEKNRYISCQIMIHNVDFTDELGAEICFAVMMF